MDGQRQQYVPLPPPPTMAQNSQSHIMTSLPPPPPRHPPTQTQGVVLPPPPGPPPNAPYGASPSKMPNPQSQQQAGMGWQPNWARQPVPQAFPPPPPPGPANQTQGQHMTYNRHPAPLSIPPPPPSDGQPLTSATYIPMGDSFGPGVGIPGLFDPYSRSTYDSYGHPVGGDRQRPMANQPYEQANIDSSSYRRDAHLPVTPSSRNIHELVSPSHPNSTNQAPELSKSSSHRHNNSSASLGGMSPNEASIQWPLERVLLWLAKNGFSRDWQETFKALELQGADFIELGYGSNGIGNFGKMHKVVYPQLAKECEKSGSGWDHVREREEGKRMRKMIRQIHDHGNLDTSAHTPKRQEPPHSAVGVVSFDGGPDNSPRLHDPVSAGPGTVESSPGLKAPHQGYNQRPTTSAQMRSVTMPNPTNHGSASFDPQSTEATTWLRADHRNLLSAAGGEHKRQSPSMSSDGGHFPLSARPHEDSPISGSPAAQHATFGHHGLSSSSTSDLTLKHDHSRGNSTDSTARGQGSTGRYYERRQGPDSARPQESTTRWGGGEAYPREHKKLLKIFKKKAKTGDCSHPSPEEQYLESPTSPVYARQNGSHILYGRPGFSASDASLGERPLSGSMSDNERLPVRTKPTQKGKKWIFVTLDGSNYRLVDITDMDSVETLRAAICQNLGISDWTSTQIFVTEPGQTEHDEPLNDTMLTVSQRTKSDSLGSLKFYVRGTSLHPGANNSAHFTGLGVSIPEKTTASPTTGQHHVHRKPLDEEALSRISPHHQPKPVSPRAQQPPKTPATKLPTRDISQPFLGVSPGDGGQETGHNIDPEKADLLARHEEHNREVERKQKAYNISKVPPPQHVKKDAAYGDTGYKREGVIDFDSPRVSPYEDKKAETLVPLRKAPSAPHESNTLTKVNSLRRKDSDRPRVHQTAQSQNHGLGAALATMGRMTSAIGTPSSNPHDDPETKSFSKKTPDETKGESQYPAWNDSQSASTSEKSPEDTTPPSPRPGLQSRKSYGPEFDFEETKVSFQRTPELQEESDDDDSDDGLFALPLSNNQADDQGKEAAGTSPETQKAIKPSLTVNTEPRLRKGLSVSFKTPNASGEAYGNSGGDKSDTHAPSSGTADSPDDERPPRRDSFARGDVWANRPPVEGVIDHLDDFFPNVDLDAPYLEGQGGSPPSSPASKHPVENDANRKEKQDGPAYTGPPSHDSEPTMKAQDPGIIARRNVNRSGGGLTRMKSIREVAKGANQPSRNRSVTSTTGNQKSGDILRRKSTKMFGAKIMQIRPGSRLNKLDPIPQNKPSPTVPQKQPTFRIIRGQLIGKGTYGRVYLGMNADNGEVLAVKQVDINSKIAGQDRDRVKEMVGALDQEIDTMQHLEHPNIVQYLGCERGDFSISIYLEYISGGSIGSCLRKHGKFEESVVQSLTQQTLSGLAYLHDSGILHRDLKADNILLDLDGSCKISDFGISKKTDNIYGNDSTNSMQGSVFWMAPEVIQSQGQGYSAKVDIWSLGCVVLEMFAGRRPWSREEAIGAIFKLGSLNQAPPIPEDVSMNISPAALAFMYDCFTVDSSDRPTAQTLLTHHPFCAPDPKYNFLDTELYAKIRHVL